MGGQGINCLLGVWLMVAPAVLGYAGPAALNDRLVGPLAAGCALVALHEVTRPLRWVNAALGLWLVLAPWVLGGGAAALLNSTLVGLLLIACASIRGPIRQRFGGGWSVLWQTRWRGAG